MNSSARKSLNLVKILTGYILSRIFRKVILWGDPVAVSIEPTNLCNLHCPECPSGTKELTRDRGCIKPEDFKKIIDQVHKDLFYLTFYFQGEPYLINGFFSMVRYARGKKIYVATSTNGHYLTPEKALATVNSGLNRIIISLDGTDQEAYSSYRIGGQYEKVVEGIRNLVEARSKAGSRAPKIVIQFLVLKTNEHQVKEIKKLTKELGADMLELKTAQFSQYINGHPLMPENHKHSRYRQVIQNQQIPAVPNSRILELKNSLPRHCWRMWSSCVVTWDGWVVPCCFDKDALHKMGNIREKPLSEIWKSEQYVQFRKRILKEREQVDICCNCTEGIGWSKFF